MNFCSPIWLVQNKNWNKRGALSRPRKGWFYLPQHFLLLHTSTLTEEIPNDWCVSLRRRKTEQGSYLSGAWSDIDPVFVIDSIFTRSSYEGNILDACVGEKLRFKMIAENRYLLDQNNGWLISVGNQWAESFVRYLIIVLPRYQSCHNPLPESNLNLSSLNLIQSPIFTKAWLDYKFRNFASLVTEL